VHTPATASPLPSLLALSALLGLATGVLLLHGCAPPLSGAALVAGPSDAGLRVEADDVVLDLRLPRMVAPDTVLRVVAPDDEEQLQPVDGALLRLGTNDAGAITTDVLRLGEDVDADRLLVETDLPTATWLTLRADLALLQPDEGGFLLQGPDAVELLAEEEPPATLQGAWLIELDEEVPAAPLAMPARGEDRLAALERLEAVGVGASAAWRPDAAQWVRPAPDAEPLATVPATTAPASAGQFELVDARSRDARASARFVGLHRHTDRGCVLLDAAGTWRACTVELPGVAGRWSVEDGRVLLREGIDADLIPPAPLRLVAP